MTPAEEIAAAAVALGRPRTLVAVDGPDAAGKTTFADLVAAALTVPVVRASVDGFHNPARVRRQRGDLSPEGYYRDSFDYTALAQELLDPFASGRRRVRTRLFDHRADAVVGATPVAVPPEAVLVFDGVFLLRPKLRDWWTLAVYLRVPPSVTLARAVVRDAVEMGGAEEVRRRYEARYLPGQELYRGLVNPEAHAHVVIDNSDVDRPVVLHWQPPGQPAQRTV
jgi:uridine kinase